MKILLLLVVFASLGFNACKPKQVENLAFQAPFKENSTSDDIKEYYLRNRWNYPVEIKTDTIIGKQISEAWAKQIDTSILKSKLSEWVITTSTYNVEACLINRITVTKESEGALFFDCNIYYYRKRDLPNNNILAPVEGHGVVEGTFYVRSERAYFSLDSETLKFLHWFEK